ncbi:MAG: PrsW family intramembrane metalloprotease [Anaerolineales bacterium]
MPVLISCCLGLVPMIGFALYVNWLDRYEKEPKVLLASAFLWGAIIAAGMAFVINTFIGEGISLLTASEAFAELSIGVFVAPIIEESLKGMALLILFLGFRKEFDSLLDGAVYGGMVGLGFGATENFYYIYALGYQEDGWEGLWSLAFVRIILVGWQHAFYTAFSGMGLAWARLNRSPSRRLVASLGGFALAIFSHAFHNAMVLLGIGLLVLPLDWFGWLAMFILILALIRSEQRLLRENLKEELNMGVLSPDQYNTAISSRAQVRARWRALTQGKFKQTVRFYQLCAELAHKKEQLRRIGEEGYNSIIIASLREELRTLSPNTISVASKR